jgi:hypothetical protein
LQETEKFPPSEFSYFWDVSILGVYIAIVLKHSKTDGGAEMLTLSIRTGATFEEVMGDRYGSNISETRMGLF